MSYREKFKEMIINSAIGYVIGLVISIILVVVVAGGNPAKSIGEVIAFTIIFGSVASIIICSKKGTQGYMSGAVSKVWSGFKGMFFGSLFAGGFSVPLIIFGLIKLMIGLIILIPIVVYMAVDYLLNMIYLGVMSLLEKFNKLEDKQDLCENLDKIVPILSLVVTVILCIVIFANM
jgi:hypothetical protein